MAKNSSPHWHVLNILKLISLCMFAYIGKCTILFCRCCSTEAQGSGVHGRGVGCWLPCSHQLKCCCWAHGLLEPNVSPWPQGDTGILCMLRVWTDLQLLFKIFICLFLTVLSLCCCFRASSSFSYWGLLSSCGVQASCDGGFSYWGPWALGHVGLVALWNVESSWTRDGTCVPCIGRQILNHWTTREVPAQKFSQSINYVSFIACAFSVMFKKPLPDL